MPVKNREVERDLLRAGFSMTPGKGSHRKYDHPKASKKIVVSGQSGADADKSLIRDAYAEIAAVKAAEEAEQKGK